MEDENEDEERPVFVRKRDRLTLDSGQPRQQTDGSKDLQIRAKALEYARANWEWQEPNIRSESEDDIPTNDEDLDLEFHAWKLRELNRINRDRQERNTLHEERMQLLRRREMTDQEVLMNQSSSFEESKERSTWKFLQKYYHKGAFYMDSTSIKAKDDVRNKDYAEPTLEDKIDKEKLPEVMRVKNFGKKGRTKYTHLVDQDTTLKESKRIDYKIDPKIYEFMAKKSKH